MSHRFPSLDPDTVVRSSRSAVSWARLALGVAASQIARETGKGGMFETHGELRPEALPQTCGPRWSQVTYVTQRQAWPGYRIERDSASRPVLLVRRHHLTPG